MFRVWLAIMFTISTQDPVHGVLLRKITFLKVRVLRAIVFTVTIHDPVDYVLLCFMQSPMIQGMACHFVLCDSLNPCMTCSLVCSELPLMIF